MLSNPYNQVHVQLTDTSSTPQSLSFQAVNDVAPAPSLTARATDRGRPYMQGSACGGSLGGTV
jgi:hypothetical protein